MPSTTTTIAAVRRAIASPRGRGAPRHAATEGPRRPDVAPPEPMPPLGVAVQDLAAHRGARIEIVCAWPEAVTLNAGGGQLAGVVGDAIDQELRGPRGAAVGSPAHD